MSIHRWFAGAFLLFLMLCALFFNSLLFSARSFQHNLMIVAANTQGIIDVAEVEAVEAKIAQFSAARAEKEVEVARAGLLVAEADKAAAELAEAYGKEIASFNTLLGEAEITAKITPPAGAAAVSGPEGFDPAIAARRLAALGAPMAQERATLSAKIAEIEDLESERATAENKLQEAQLAASRAAGAQRDIDAQILGLKAAYGDSFDQVVRETQALQASSPLGIGVSLVGMHPVFLSTLLACVMGGLGAILFLFPAYVANKMPITFVVIVVRLIFGMVTALAFYIVANASIAGLSFVPGDPNSAATTSLNPFTVSLLGIIAGIMADDIADWIHKRGREILGAAGKIGGSGEAAAVAAPMQEQEEPYVAPQADSAYRPAPAVGYEPGGDPMASAAQDAAAMAQPAPIGAGAEPPRGGVVNRG